MKEKLLIHVARCTSKHSTKLVWQQSDQACAQSCSQQLQPMTFACKQPKLGCISNEPEALLTLSLWRRNQGTGSGRSVLAADIQTCHAM